MPALPVAGLGHRARRPRAARSRRRSGRRDRCSAALDWLAPLQVLDVKGDWAARRPDVRPGGWAFQYANPHYPDTRRHRRGGDGDGPRGSRRRHRALRTPIRRRSRARANGSRDCRAATAPGPPSTPTTPTHYLNHIPFADHGALLDPPTADVTARCVSMLAQLGETRETSPVLARGDRRPPRRSGEGRKLVRPLGHELHLRNLVGAMRAGDRRPGSAIGAGAPRRRVARQRIQNADGGWGESGEQLQARLQGLRARAQHRLADGLGAARADGGGRGRSSRPSPAASPISRRPKARTASGTSRSTPRPVSRACSICAITAIRSFFRSGRWPAIAISSAATAAPRCSACEAPRTPAVRPGNDGPIPASRT